MAIVKGPTPAPKAIGPTPKSNSEDKYGQMAASRTPEPASKPTIAQRLDAAKSTAGSKEPTKIAPGLRHDVTDKKWDKITQGTSKTSLAGTSTTGGFGSEKPRNGVDPTPQHNVIKGGKATISIGHPRNSGAGLNTGISVPDPDAPKRGDTAHFHERPTDKSRQNSYGETPHNASPKTFEVEKRKSGITQPFMTAKGEVTHTSVRKTGSGFTGANPEKLPDAPTAVKKADGGFEHPEAKPTPSAEDRQKRANFVYGIGTKPKAEANPNAVVFKPGESKGFEHSPETGRTNNSRNVTNDNALYRPTNKSYDAPYESVPGAKPASPAYGQSRATNADNHSDEKRTPLLGLPKATGNKQYSVNTNKPAQSFTRGQTKKKGIDEELFSEAELERLAEIEAFDLDEAKRKDGKRVPMAPSTTSAPVKGPNSDQSGVGVKNDNAAYTISDDTQPTGSFIRELSYPKLMDYRAKAADATRKGNDRSVGLESSTAKIMNKTDPKSMMAQPKMDPANANRRIRAVEETINEIITVDHIKPVQMPAPTVINSKNGGKNAANLEKTAVKRDNQQMKSANEELFSDAELAKLNELVSSLEEGNRENKAKKAKFLIKKGGEKTGLAGSIDGSEQKREARKELKETTVQDIAAAMSKLPSASILPMSSGPSVRDTMLTCWASRKK